MKASCDVCVIVVALVMCVRAVSAFVLNHHPNDIPEPEQQADDIECAGWGSDNGMSLSGNYRYWYTHMRDHYTGCTYVSGNLILTWFEDPDIDYDFSFLHNIRYVRGYVLIAMANFHGELPLVNLEVIRGNRTFTFHGEEFGLAILLTNFTKVQMPRLKEISRGSVVAFANKPDLRIELCRSWDAIMRGRVSSDATNLLIEDAVTTMESELCWGWNNILEEVYYGDLTTDYDMCSFICPWRCFAPGTSGCCHSQCAGGCSGPGTRQCQTCKDYSVNGNCVSHCPTVDYIDYYPEGGQCKRP